jgi:hypothetical protein
MREIDSGAPAGELPDGPPLERWELAAVGPTWRPPIGETTVYLVDGVLELHPDALVFRAREVVDSTTGSPLVGVIPATSIVTIGPLSPGSAGSGAWMPGWQQRFRSPGFVVGTDVGAWVFDGPKGPRRARELRERFGIA